MTDDLLTFRSFGSKKCSIYVATRNVSRAVCRDNQLQKNAPRLGDQFINPRPYASRFFCKMVIRPLFVLQVPNANLPTYTYLYTDTHTHTYIYTVIYIQLYIYGVVHTVHLCINSWVWQTMTMDLWGRKKTISSSLLLEGHQRCANLTVIVVHSDQHLIQQLGLRSLQGWGMDKQWQKPDCQMEILSFSTKEA